MCSPCTYAYNTSDSLEGATVYHHAAMQSRTVAHSLQITDDGRQHPFVAPNGIVSGERERERKREREREILRVPGLSQRRFRRNMREMARHARFPDEMTFGNVCVCVRE